MPYAELHAHSNFSFLDGANHPEELVAEAARLGLSALALTDHNGLYGVVRFAEMARRVGLPTVFGAELSLAPSESRTGQPDLGAITSSCWPGTPRVMPDSAGPSPKVIWAEARREDPSSSSTTSHPDMAGTGRY